MKNFFYVFIIVLFSSNLFAQAHEYDKRLLVKYTKNELAELEQNNPEKFKYINYCLDKAWYLAPLPKEKMKNNDGRIGEIEIKDIKNINFYALNLEIVKDDYQFFAIKGTEQMLVIKSEDHIKKEIN